MSDLPDELPSDPAELRVFAAALLDRCARLERLLKLAKDAQFGRSSEKLDLISSGLFWRISIRPSPLSKRPRIAQLPKHARGEQPGAGPIVVGCRSICHASSKR